MHRTQKLRQMSNDQLTSRLKQLRMEIMRAEGHNTIPPSSRMSGGDTKYLHRMKKEVARINTILAERTLRRKQHALA